MKKAEREDEPAAGKLAGWLVSELLGLVGWWAGGPTEGREIESERASEQI